MTDEVEPINDVKIELTLLLVSQGEYWNVRCLIKYNILERLSFIATACYPYATLNYQRVLHGDWRYSYIIDKHRRS